MQPSLMHSTSKAAPRGCLSQVWWQQNRFGSRDTRGHHHVMGPLGPGEPQEGPCS